MKIFIYLTFFAMVFLMSVQISGNSIDRKLQNSGVVSLKASETREITPDLAKINITVENISNNVENASLENAKISVQISDALHNELDLKKEEVKTSTLSVYPVIEKAGNKKQIKKYKAKTTITAETRDLNNVSNIIEIATKNGATSANNVIYSVQNEKEACKNIYPEIINELKNQANDIAKINEQYVIGVKSMDLTCKTNTYSSAKRVLLKDSITNAIQETESIATEAGKIRVTATVDAKYTISR